MAEIDWLTIPEACSYLKVSRSTLYNWEKTGRLAMFRFGGMVRIRRDDLNRLARTRTQVKGPGEEERQSPE
ncbi:MAG: helix-turn-helix domain-containing protein [Chitinophagales bacterium]